MSEFADKYVNLFTDFGFKKIFGEEPNKDILIDFLNALLKAQEGKIKDLKYLRGERLSLTESERRAVFDLYCENERGEKFLVELQKAKQKFFKDRMLYYSTFPISQQAERADWNHELRSVYAVAILDFVFDADKKDANKFRYDVQLSDIETKEVFYDKLTFVYLEMPKFRKPLREIESRYEKWLYVLRHLNRLQRVPDKLRERIFERVFEVAEIAKFTPAQVRSYEGSLKTYRDLNSSFDTARSEGMEKGRKEEKVSSALNAIAMGLSDETIVKITGLSIKEIEGLRERGAKHNE